MIKYPIILTLIFIGDSLNWYYLSHQEIGFVFITVLGCLVMTVFSWISYFNWRNRDY